MITYVVLTKVSRGVIPMWVLVAQELNMGAVVQGVCDRSLQTGGSGVANVTRINEANAVFTIDGVEYSAFLTTAVEL